MSLARRRELVSAIMGRADAWQPAGKPPSVNPLAALASLITASLSLFKRNTGVQPPPPPQNVPPAPPLGPSSPVAGVS
ncbi:MAG TPA: hypothetical protein PKA17_05560, partial [Phenylobacterium sp.]|nr:hypothetical protein [Phenylobacterium sp.]